MKDPPDQFDLFDGLDRNPRHHARASDPPTSHEAATAINITEQAIVILRAYRDRRPLLDVEAYRRAGFPPHACDGQRCSDLRHAGYIARTGERGATPSGRAAYYCMITPTGSAYLDMIDAIRMTLEGAS